jgi:hypothetical protein
LLATGAEPVGAVLSGVVVRIGFVAVTLTGVSLTIADATGSAFSLTAASMEATAGAAYVYTGVATVGVAVAATMLVVALSTADGEAEGATAVLLAGSESPPGALGSLPDVNTVWSVISTRNPVGLFSLSGSSTPHVPPHI